MKATGNGIIRELDELVNMAIPGFKIDKTTDHGLVVTVKETLALAGVPLQPKNPWGWVWAAALFLVCGVGLYFLLRPAPGTATEQAAAYALPAQLTPFTVLSLLRQMEQDARLDLPADRRTELAESIRDLERRHFGPGAETNGQIDLERLAREWVSRAS